MGNSILTKFKVGSVTDFANNNHNVQMSPVTSDSEENKSFSLYTPSGKIEMHITNPEAIGFFKPGHEYYVEFVKSFTPSDRSKIFVLLNELYQLLNDEDLDENKMRIAFEGLIPNLADLLNRNKFY